MCFELGVNAFLDWQSSEKDCCNCWWVAEKFLYLVVVHLHQIPWKCIDVEVASSPALLDMSVFHHFSVKYRFVIFALKLYYAGWFLVFEATEMYFNSSSKLWAFLLSRILLHCIIRNMWWNPKYIFFIFLTVTNNISLLYLKVNYIFSLKTQQLSYKERFSQSNEFLTDKIKAVDLCVDVVDRL